MLPACPGISIRRQIVATSSKLNPRWPSGKWQGWNFALKPSEELTPLGQWRKNEALLLQPSEPFYCDVLWGFRSLHDTEGLEYVHGRNNSLSEMWQHVWRLDEHPVMGLWDMPYHVYGDAPIYPSLIITSISKTTDTALINFKLFSSIINEHKLYFS